MKKGMLSAAAVLALCGAAQAELIYGLTTRNQLVTFDSATPGLLTTSHFITGLQPAEEIIGIDFRPATGELYGIGSSSRVYRLNVNTAVATAVGGSFAPPQLNGVEFGVDFNPVVDRIRLVSDLEQNLRLDPNTGGLTAQDPNLSYASGANPNVVGVAYTNNFAGAASTTLFAIDSVTNGLATINTGTGVITAVGGLGFDTSGLVGFDISGGTGTAFASMTSQGGAFSSLYTINLATGASTLVGQIAVGTDPTLIRDITVIAIPAPGSLALLAVGGLVGARRRKR